jgi:hypothetical protein
MGDRPIGAFDDLTQDEAEGAGEAIERGRRVVVDDLGEDVGWAVSPFLRHMPSEP